MCGIAGFVSNSRGRDEKIIIAKQMIAAIKHRGPDGDGYWIDDPRVALVHTRLAIVDLSALGHQPMTSRNGGQVITFNGEIYNHKLLRTQLIQEGCVFKGHSDTEVLVNWIEQHGVRPALNAITGMFAFCVVDLKARTLTLARDRVGEKPLYYGRIGNDFVFSSELKPLLKYPGASGKLNSSAVNLYVKYGYVPSPLSIMDGIHKLPAGHSLTLALDDLKFDSKSEPYWDRARAVHAPKWNVSEAEAVDQIGSRLSQVIAGQLEADVPIGCFLSGGIDSSLIAALAQERSSKPLRTFTIGFEEKAYNEAPFAKQVAEHLGCAHHEWIISARDCRDLVTEMPNIFDEPFSDSSQLPTTLVARLTRSEVTVCLSGDGGDELFCGYNRYAWAKTLCEVINTVPGPLRRAASHMANAIPIKALNRLLQLLPIVSRYPNPADKLIKLLSVLMANSESELYDHLLSTWSNPGEILRNYRGEHLPLVREASLSFEEFMMFEDSRHYLCDDIMVKVDRATMSVGLESRAPFLDHQLFELLWSMPLSLKIRKGTTKHLARRLLARHIPEEWMDRPKTGFGVPIGSWLRTDLKDWAGDLLSPKVLKRHGLFREDVIEKMFREHVKGERNWQNQLWNMVMFQAWYERWIR